MSLIQQNLILEQIAKMFLNEGRARFDILDFVLTKQDLLQKKPVILMALIYAKLNLKKGDFNEGSFRVWLRRYRTSHVGNSKEKTTLPSSETQPREQKAKEFPLTEKKERTAFKFTDPSTIKKEEKPLLRYVNPDDYK